MRRFMFGVLTVLFLSAGSSGQAPPTYSVTIDTTLYEMTIYKAINAVFIPSAIPMDATMNPNIGTSFPGTVFLAYRRKGSTTVDIFSLSGKIGSVTLPLVDDIPTAPAYTYLFSQTIIDADEGWECLRVVKGGSSDPFTLFDSDGTQLLSDSGTAFYGYDGKDTYVISATHAMASYSIVAYRCWRFRTDVASASPSSPLKKTLSSPGPMMTFGAAGNFQVMLQPAGGGKTSVQLFDCIGRLLFDKTIDNITKPTTFTIPEYDVPKTPFIAKFRDNNGNTIRKAIPVR
jgi:hypothetical protein